MADSISIFGVRTGDEGVRRDLHIASSLGDGTDLFVAISMVRVVRVDDAAVDVIEQGFKGARRHTIAGKDARSEEHTSELQSPCNLVCRLLLEKKKDLRPNNSVWQGCHREAIRLGGRGSWLSQRDNPGILQCCGECAGSLESGRKTQAAPFTFSGLEKPDKARSPCFHCRQRTGYFS